MNNDIKMLIDYEKYNEMILNLIGSDEINKKYIDNTVFKDNDTSRSAVIHGLILGCMLMTKCGMHYESSKIKSYSDNMSDKDKIILRRKLAMELVNRIHEEIGIDLGYNDDTNKHFIPSYACIELIMDTLRVYEMELIIKENRYGN